MSAGPFSLLVVEDAPADVLVLREALDDAAAALSCTVIVAGRLREACERLEAARFDAVLLDLGLPDAQGVETFVALQRRAAGVPVLVLTGLNDRAVGLQAVQLGAQDYLLKGQLSPELLGRAVRYAIERHRHAAALAASEDRFQLAVEGASSGLWDWNPRTDEVYFSPHLRRLLGFTAEQLPDVADRYRELVHPEDRALRVAAVEGHLRRREPFDVEYRLRRADGSYGWYRVHGQARWDETGRPYRMAGWVTDISRLKRSELEAVSSRELLRQLIARLRDVRERERIRIAREIHDELGQQLTASKMDLRWIGRHLAEPSSDEQRRSIQRKLADAELLIDRSIERVQRIAIELRPGVLDQLGLVAAIRDEVRRFEERSGICCVAELAEDAGSVPPDVGTAFFRILEELLTNVARHSGAGSVAVRLARRPGGLLELQVADNGRGFDVALRDRRTSLGLLGMSERATAFGGEVAIESAPGQGCRTIVRIPVPALPS